MIVRDAVLPKGLFKNAHRAKLVLYSYADRADDAGGGARPSLKTVGSESMNSRKTVEQILARASAANLMAVEAPPGQHRARQYRLNLAALQQLNPDRQALGSDLPCSDRDAQTTDLHTPERYALRTDHAEREHSDRQFESSRSVKADSRSVPETVPTNALIRTLNDLRNSVSEDQLKQLVKTAGELLKKHDAVPADDRNKTVIGELETACGEIGIDRSVAAWVLDTAALKAFMGRAS